MQLLSKPSSQFPFLFLSDLLPPPAKTRFSPANLAVILAGILFSAAAFIWIAIPILFKLLSSIPRSSAAPRYLFIAVNFIIFAVWKLSETRPSVNEIGSIPGESVGEKPVSVDGVYLSRSALVSKKNLDYDVVSVDRQDLGASDTDRNEIASIYGESVDLEHYIEKPISIADSSSSSFSSGVSVLQSTLIRKKNSDHGVVLHRSQDLRASHTDRNEMTSIHGEFTALDHYIKKPISIAASFLSSFSSVLSVLQSALLPKKSSDHEVVHHRRQDLGSSHTDGNEIALMHEENSTLEHYIEKPISIAACSSSSVSSIVYLPQPSLLPKENSDHEVVSLDRQDLASSHTDRNKIASIHEQNVSLEHYYIEKPIAVSAATSTSSFTSALRVKNGEMEEMVVNDLDEENSLEATWNSIMPKTAGTKTGGGVSAGMRREGNARSEGDHDEINRRFEEFIKKSYDQIRLRKPGEMK